MSKVGGFACHPFPHISITERGLAAQNLMRTPPFNNKEKFSSFSLHQEGGVQLRKDRDLGKFGVEGIAGDFFFPSVMLQTDKER